MLIMKFKSANNYFIFLERKYLWLENAICLLFLEGRCVENQTTSHRKYSAAKDMDTKPIFGPWDVACKSPFYYIISGISIFINPKTLFELFRSLKNPDYATKFRFL